MCGVGVDGSIKPTPTPTPTTNMINVVALTIVTPKIDSFVVLLTFPITLNLHFFFVLSTPASEGNRKAVKIMQAFPFLLLAHLKLIVVTNYLILLLEPKTLWTTEVV